MDWDKIGTTSSLHTWVGYLAAPVLTLFPWIWSLLAIGHITYTADVGKVWVNLTVASIYLGLTVISYAVLRLKISEFQKGPVPSSSSSKSEETLNWRESAAALINDDHYLKSTIISAASCMLVELVVYIVFFNLPPTATLRTSFHQDDATLFMSKGVGRMIAAAIGHAICFVLSTFTLVVFFNTTTQFSLLNNLVAVADSSKGRTEAARTGFASQSQSAATLASWGDKPAKV